MSRRAVGLSAIAGLFFAVDLMTFHYAVDVDRRGARDGDGQPPGRDRRDRRVAGVRGAAAARGDRRDPGDAARGRADLGDRRRAGRTAPTRALGVAIGPDHGGVVRRATCWSSGARARTGGPRRPSRSRPPSPRVFALVFGLAVGDIDLVPSLPAHAYLLALGVLSQSIGYLAIQVSLPRLPAVITLGAAVRPAGDDACSSGRSCWRELPSPFAARRRRARDRGIALATGQPAPDPGPARQAAGAA